MIPQEPFSIKSSKEIAKSIIDKLGPDDLTAIVFTGDNRKTQDFTSDKTKLVAALDKFNPGLAGYRFGMDSSSTGPRTDRHVDTDLWFYQSSVRTLRQRRGLSDRRAESAKGLFWVSPGVPMDLVDCEPCDDASLIPLELPRQPADGMRLPPPTWVDLQHRHGRDLPARAARQRHDLSDRSQSASTACEPYLSGAPRPGERSGSQHHKADAHAGLSWHAAAANTGGRAVMNINEFEPGDRRDLRREQVVLPDRLRAGEHEERRHAAQAPGESRIGRTSTSARAAVTTRQSRRSPTRSSDDDDARGRRAGQGDERHPADRRHADARVGRAVRGARSAALDRHGRPRRQATDSGGRGERSRHGNDGAADERVHARRRSARRAAAHREGRTARRRGRRGRVRSAGAHRSAGRPLPTPPRRAQLDGRQRRQRLRGRRSCRTTRTFRSRRRRSC